MTVERRCEVSILQIFTKCRLQPKTRYRKEVTYFIVRFGGKGVEFFSVFVFFQR